MILKTRAIGSWFCLFSLLYFFHCLLLGLPRSSGMALGPQCSLSHFQPLPHRGWAQFSSSCAPWRRNSWWSKACLLSPFLGGMAVPCTGRSPPKQQVPKASRSLVLVLCHLRAWCCEGARTQAAAASFRGCLAP